MSATPGTRGARLAVSAMLLAACRGGTADTVVASPSPADKPEFVAARAAAANDFWRACCARLWGVDFDAGAWRDAGVFDPYAGYYPAPEAHLAYDPALGAECIAGLRAAARSCALTKAAADALDRACFAYRGTLPAGAGCTDGVECAAPASGRAVCSRGSPMTTSASGTCTVLDRGAEGDLCDPFADAGALHFCDPADGLVCGEAGACERRRTLGAACVRISRYADLCADGSYCGDTGKCAARKATGSACHSSEECLSGICSRDLCADTEPVPSVESCGANQARPTPDAAADSAADAVTDAADSAADAVSDAEGG
jgi:hypothetical protein